MMRLVRDRKDGCEMKENKDAFYAKVLLFGEYSVIYNSMALTMPYTHFMGELSFIGEDKYTDCEFALASNKSLKEYAYYLEDLRAEGSLLCDFNVEEFRRELKKGLYFESSIPQGYGMGSSGALVAALYTRYVADAVPASRTISPEEIRNLKKTFSQLESYFHGTSSGIDPLNCYISYPLLFRNSEDIEIVGIPRNKHDRNGAIFAINTGRSGKTGPLVSYFMDKCQEPRFFQKVQEEFIPRNNACIQHLIKGETSSFFTELKALSAYQLEYMDPMIPSDYRRLWENGLRSEDYLLKLCGSGGGGFILGFTEHFDKVKSDLIRLGKDIVTIYRNPGLDA